MHKEILIITLGLFYELLLTDQCFVNILVLSHIRKQTHTWLEVPYSSLNLCLSNQEPDHLNTLKYMNEW